jgi:hypothetical protein
MIYITQLIYLKENGVKDFLAFEQKAIPIIEKYNGKLLFRIRPSPDDYIELNIDSPYEIHLVSFDSESDFENFGKDNERKSFLHLKKNSVKVSTLFKGVAI